MAHTNGSNEKLQKQAGKMPTQQQVEGKGFVEQKETATGYKTMKRYVHIYGSILTLIIFFGSFDLAFATLTYDRDPSGSPITAPITVDVSFDNADLDVPMVGETYWCVIALENGELSRLFEATSIEPADLMGTMSGIFTIPIPEGTSIGQVFIQGLVDDSMGCDADNGGNDGYSVLENGDPEAFYVSESESEIDLSGFAPIYSLPYGSPRIATTTCNEITSTTTQCITEYIPEITYSDWLFAITTGLFLISFLAWGYFFSPFKPKL